MQNLCSSRNSFFRKYFSTHFWKSCYCNPTTNVWSKPQNNHLLLIFFPVQITFLHKNYNSKKAQNCWTANQHYVYEHILCIFFLHKCLKMLILLKYHVCSVCPLYIVPRFFFYVLTLSCIPYRLIFQLFIEGSCQLQYHGAGHSRIGGAQKRLVLVILGIEVTGQDKAALG